ncbi:hypothetical protein JCM3766R1_002403 [Sporobolomyces carnicolor]
MSLPEKPSNSAQTASGIATGSSTGARSSPVLPSKPLGLPLRPSAPLGSTSGAKSDTDREEGEEEEPNPPPLKRAQPTSTAPPRDFGPPPRRERGRSPSYDRDDREPRFAPRGGGGGGGARFDPYYDDRRVGRGRMVSRSPPSPARSFRSGRSWSRSRSRSPPPPRRGGPGRGGYRGFARRPFSRSPPLALHRLVDLILEDPLRRATADVRDHRRRGAMVDLADTVAFATASETIPIPAAAQEVDFAETSQG